MECIHFFIFTSRIKRRFLTRLRPKGEWAFLDHGSSQTFFWDDKVIGVGQPFHQVVKVGGDRGSDIVRRHKHFRYGITMLFTGVDDNLCI